MKKARISPKTHWGEDLEKKISLNEEGNLEKKRVSLSIVIPVFNCSQMIALTLQSIKAQNYSPLEVIVIDGGSTDRTLEVVNQFVPLVSRIYTSATPNVADMINRGITLSSGRYLTFLLPGSVYIGDVACASFTGKVLDTHFPDVLYCGSILWEINREPRIIQLPFETALLQKGKHPAVLPSCWFRSDLFEKVGKLDQKYQICYGFDFFCRIMIEKDIHIISIDRVFIDVDSGRFSYRRALRYFSETWRILVCYFGTLKALIWLMTRVNYLLIVKGIWGYMKTLIFKK